MKNLPFLFICVVAFSCQPKQKEIKPYTIDQFYESTRIIGGSFNTAEDRLLVSSDESGIFNVYEINLSDTVRKPVTHSTADSYFAVDYVPGSTGILYSSDKGGNEIDHLYLLDADGSSRDLTPGEKEKAGFSGWSRDKKAFYYSSNKRNPQFFDFYKMNLDGWKSRLLYQNNQGLDLADISDDENLVSLQKAITTSENELYILNLKTGKMTEISDSTRPGTYFSADFSHNGKYFYYLTDAGKEFVYLAAYDLSDGTRKTLFETNWDVMYSYESEYAKYRVIAINEDGKNSIIVLDSTGKKIDFPTIPGGDVQAVNISDKEDLMRLTIGTSNSTADLYLYNFETSDLKRLTRTLNPEIDPSNLVEAKVVRFKSFDGLEIPAIYYQPLMAGKRHKVPAIINVHGGPGGQSRLGYSSFIQFLVNHGYAVLSVNNRGSSGYGKTFYKLDDRDHGDKDLKDCIWGKKWLQSQDYIDTGKIGILGGSYGGFMVMAAMTSAPGEFKAGVDLFGVTNWLRTLKSTPAWWASFRDALFMEMGDPFTADSVRLKNISPLFHADKIKDPIMVLQGANDPRVLPVESDEIVAAARKNNVPVEYVVFPDEGHGFVKKENEIKGYGLILGFLDKYLK